MSLYMFLFTGDLLVFQGVLQMLLPRSLSRFLPLRAITPSLAFSNPVEHLPNPGQEGL